MEDIIVDEDVVSEECQFTFHIDEESSNNRSQMNDMSWLVLLKETTSLLCVSQVGLR